MEILPRNLKILLGLGRFGKMFEETWPWCNEVKSLGSLKFVGIFPKNLGRYSNFYLHIVLLKKRLLEAVMRPLLILHV